MVICMYTVNQLKALVKHFQRSKMHCQNNRWQSNVNSNIRLETDRDVLKNERREWFAGKPMLLIQHKTITM